MHSSKVWRMPPTTLGLMKGTPTIVVVEGVAIGQRDRVKEAEDNLRSAAHNWRRALRFDAAKRAEQRAQEVALKCQHTIRKDGPRKVRERQRLVLGSTTIPRHTVPSRLQANHLSGLSAWRAAGAFTIVIEDQLSARIAGAIRRQNYAIRHGVKVFSAHRRAVLVKVKECSPETNALVLSGWIHHRANG